jgi:hypothetical protein
MCDAEAAVDQERFVAYPDNLTRPRTLERRARATRTQQGYFQRVWHRLPLPPSVTRAAAAVPAVGPRVRVSLLTRGRDPASIRFRCANAHHGAYSICGPSRYRLSFLLPAGGRL